MQFNSSELQVVITNIGFIVHNIINNIQKIAQTCYYLTTLNDHFLIQT